MHKGTIDRLDSVNLTGMSLAVTREGLALQATGLLKGDDLLGPQGTEVTVIHKAWPEPVMQLARQLLATAEKHVLSVLGKEGRPMPPPPPERRAELEPPPDLGGDDGDGDIASSFREDVQQF